jgi:anti-sigma regulatory factor (Ser/Thr protein kinase)
MQMQVLFPANKKGIADANKLMEEFSESGSLSASTRAKLMIIVDELISNSLKYGSIDKENQRLELNLSFENSTLFIDYADSGVEFNPFEMEAEGLELSAEERDIGGLGIHLVRKLTDTQSYTREHDRNKISLRLKVE